MSDQLLRPAVLLFLMHLKWGYRFWQIVSRVWSFSSDVFRGMDGIFSTNTIKYIVQFAAKIAVFAHSRHDGEPPWSGWVADIRCALTILLEQWGCE